MKKSTQVLMDKDKVEHVIYNFLSNAFKYTSQGGKVKVIIKEVENKIRIVVKDSGIGISKEDLPNLFERFFQAENAQKAGSSGIGLALCREIAELLDGKVWVESEVGKGSSFYFEMPYEEYLGIIESEELTSQNAITNLSNQGIETLSANSSKDLNQQFTILLVEDNPELREYIQVVLSEFYNVHVTENGQEAMKWLAEHSEPSLIVSDLMMPIMDGFELLNQIKQSENYRHIPMLMLTARQSIEVKLSALQLGVDDYVTKPFNEQELLFRIRNLMNNQQERFSFLQEELDKENKISKSQKSSSINNKTKVEIPIKISAGDQKWLSELQELVTSQLHNSQFNVTFCAQKFFMSERQLQRRIKKCTGLNFTKYLRLARLRLALKLLESGKVDTISELSYQVGFETPAYFSKLFYQEFGQNPTTYFQ